MVAAKQPPPLQHFLLLLLLLLRLKLLLGFQLLHVYECLGHLLGAVAEKLNSLR